MNENHSEALPKAPLDTSVKDLALNNAMDNRDSTPNEVSVPEVALESNMKLREEETSPNPIQVIREHSPDIYTASQTPDPESRGQALLDTALHPQTATVITISPDHLENMRAANQRREVELMREAERQKMLRRLFSQNMLYSKPNICVAQSMLTLLAFSIFFFLPFFVQGVGFKHLVIAYAIDAVSEGVLILLFSQCSFLTTVYKPLIWIPYSAKVVGLIVVGTDLAFNWGGSAYLCFLPIVTAIGTVIPRTSYSAIKPMPACLSIFISICELLGMIRLGIDKGATYSTLFIILFYYFLVTFFFNLIGFLSSLLAFCAAICNCFKQFRYRVFLVQFLLGTDNIIAVGVCLEFSNWLYYTATLKNLQQRISQEPLNSQLLEQTAYFQEAVNKSTNFLEIIASVLLAYVIIRSSILFWCTKDELPTAQQIELRSGMLIGQVARPGATTVPAGAQAQQPFNQPRVEQPNTKDTILNLFRVNANYYSSNSQPAQPAVAAEKREEGDELCTICINEPTNCIILECRHGGICKKCALDMLRKSSCCPFCRSPITKVCVVLKIADSQYRVVEEIKL